jgi:hypothetical protein
LNQLPSESTTFDVDDLGSADISVASAPGGPFGATTTLTFPAEQTIQILFIQRDTNVAASPTVFIGFDAGDPDYTGTNTTFSVILQD